MSPQASLSYTTALILQAIASGYPYGFDVMDITGLPSGTVYPALRRMEEAGFVESRWENELTAQRDGRPVRKYYEITREGKEVLTEALKRYRHMERLLPTAGRKKPTPERG